MLRILGFACASIAAAQDATPALASLSLGTPAALAPVASASGAAPQPSRAAAATTTASILDETRQRMSAFKSDANADAVRRIMEATEILKRRNAALVAANAAAAEAPAAAEAAEAPVVVAEAAEAPVVAEAAPAEIPAPEAPEAAAAPVADAAAPARGSRARERPEALPQPEHAQRALW